MNYQQLVEILGIVNTKNDLNESNIIERIKEEKEKKENSGTDQELDDDESDYAFDDEPKLLHTAVEENFAKVAEVLIKKGVNIDIEAGEYGSTLLHWAAEYGHLKIVNALIEKNADAVNKADEDGRTPLYLAIERRNRKTVKFLMDKGADPLLVSKDAKMLKFLIKQHLEKAEESQQSKGQIDDKYESFKYSFLFGDNHHLIDIVEKNTFGNLICTWLADESNLTPNQKQLNIKLLGMLKDLPDCRIIDLDSFLRNNKGNDLKAILNRERGESKLTVLHAVSSMDWRANECMGLLLSAGANPNAKDDRGKTPLHYATDSYIISSLLRTGADPNIKDNKGKTPLEVAIDNHNYHLEYHFLTDEQRNLKEELDSALEDNSQSQLEKLLNEHKNTHNLKRILNLRDYKGKSHILEYARTWGFETYRKEAERLLLKAGAIDYKESNQKEHSPKSGTLWDNLISRQQESLKEFLGEVDKVPNMNELKKTVTKAIERGIRFNFPHQGKLYGKAYENKYSCMDYVIKRIKDLSKSEKNSKVASDIICKLVSIGAVLYDIDSMDLIDTLELEFEGHKANMVQAFIEYKNYTLEFIEIAKSAATGEVKDAKIDNSTLYLEYSEDSTINVAKITDKAKSLGLTGKTGYGRDVIKIGKSEVEIITQNDIRNYIDLANGSDIVLTFFTSQGELEVRLYPDKQNQDWIRVEGNKEMLENLEDYGEEIGKNCRLGGLSVEKAVGQGYFTRSGGLMRSEEMGQSKEKTKESSWREYVESSRALNSGREIINIE